MSAGREATNRLPLCLLSLENSECTYLVQVSVVVLNMRVHARYSESAEGAQHLLSDISCLCMTMFLFFQRDPDLLDYIATASW